MQFNHHLISFTIIMLLFPNFCTYKYYCFLDPPLFLYTYIKCKSMLLIEILLLLLYIITNPIASRLFVKDQSVLPERILFC